MALNNIIVLALNLPKIDFIQAFAKKHNRDSITIYLPDNLSNDFRKWHKTFKMRHLMLPISYTFTNSNITQLQANAKDLHVYIPDITNLGGSMSHFIQLFSQRTRDNP